MRLQHVLAATAAGAVAPALAATGVLAEPQLPAHHVPRSVEEFRLKHPYRAPGGAAGYESGRRQVRIRASAGPLDDVSGEFEAGLREANGGGTLHLVAGETYVIGRPLDLTFLDDVHVWWEGTVRFTDDTAYWQGAAFSHPFQNSLMFWKWGGKDIVLYGEGGVLDGAGQRWWDEFAGREILDPGNEYLRPVLFYAENATRLAVSGLHQRDPPCWANFVVGSRDVSFEDVALTAVSTNASSLPKNTDFFDSLNVEGVRVRRAWVDVGDDCFSPKSNASRVHVDTMYCNGTHGQSLGSLGQYPGEMSYVRDVLIENVWLLNGDNGARIKTWAGPEVGYGFVDNVTFRNFWQANNDFSAQIDSCYFNIPAEECARYPSRVNITNVTFENFTGSTSGKNGAAVARLACSAHPDAVCDGITLRDFHITSPCAAVDPSATAVVVEPVVICDGIDANPGSGLEGCVPSDSDAGRAALAANCSSPLASIEPPF